MENLHINKLREKASRLPLQPGVYIMKDKNGKVIYVGKSKVLKNRVSQYFQDTAHDFKTSKMVSNVADFDYMLTDTEIEALSLENRLIKLHTPKFNIKLKDGKSYPYIKITMNNEYPELSVVRKRSADNAKYFGPYTGMSTAYSIMKTAQKTFKLASCSHEFPRDVGKIRPCLYYQIGQCAGPCTGNISADEYKDIFKDVVTFMRGRYDEVKNSLAEKMEYASENLMFESAALYRDRIAALDKLGQKQKVVGSPDVDEDIIALYSDELCSCATVFYVRAGSIVDSEHFMFSADSIVEVENMTSFITDLYMKREYIPRDVLLSFELSGDDILLLSEFLRGQAGYKVHIRKPERGDLKALCDMVYDNAAQHASQYQSESEKDNKTLIRLAELLKLEVVPERIEAFDISNYGNENITAGMISVEHGKLQKSGYRVYKINSTDIQDDYASMQEAVNRRFSHADNEFPDLILLDGGKGHVSTIRHLLDDMGIDIPVFGMVKDEYHKTRALTDEVSEISIAREQSVFQLIYKIQEEVHRFTVSRMNASKEKTMRRTSLEKIRGIGSSKAQALIKHFKSVSAVRIASREELLSVKGISERNADEIISYYQKIQQSE